MQSKEIIEKIKELKPEINMELNDLGNGWLFASVFKDSCRYNATVKEWFFYKNGVWKQDVGGMVTSKYAKELADGKPARVAAPRDKEANVGDRVVLGLSTKKGYGCAEVTAVVTGVQKGENND